MILVHLLFLSFSVAGIPYAGLTAVLTAAFAFVPYIGGFLSCAFRHFIYFIGGSEQGAPMLDRLSGNSVC